MTHVEIHLTALAITACVIVVTDSIGFLYLIGYRKTIPHALVVWAHRLVWVGLFVMVWSGVAMAIPMWEYLRVHPPFYVKMVLVLALSINAVAIGALSHVTTSRPFAELPAHTKRAMFLCGAISTTSWVGTTLIGFFFM